MNVLYIHTHDTGRFIQPYGYGVETPALMEFAKRGTVFRHAFSAAPTCSPSRAALLTGQYPHSCGMLGLAHRGFQMADYSQHMASFFREQGYKTILCGIQHEAPEAEMLGYSRILGGQEFDMGCLEFDSRSFDMKNSEQVCLFLKSEPKEPFFLSFGLFNTHREYPEPDADICPEYIMAAPGLPDCEETRGDMAAYATSARIADRAIGNVLRALECSGLSSSTAVIYTTDHGLALPGMKCTLYDYGTAVGLIMDYPGNPSRGRAYDSLVSHIDLFPTLCDLCGLETPGWIQGVSALPVLEKEKEEVREEVYSEVNFHVSYDPMRAVRTKRYKLIRRFDEDLTTAMANIDDSPSKEFLAKEGCLGGEQASVELYDLYRDPGEKNNLAEIPEYHKMVVQLSEKLLDWMVRTGDPLLEGDIKAPWQALVKARTAYSAKTENAMERSR